MKSLNSLHATHLSSNSGLACNCSQQISTLRKQAFEFEKSSHPGFVISFDNLDLQLQRKICQCRPTTVITTTNKQTNKPKQTLRLEPSMLPW